MTDTTSPQPAAPATATTTTVPSELPAALREKLRPDLQPHRLDGIADKARALARRLRAHPGLAQAAAQVKKALPPLSKAGATALARVKRFNTPARARLQTTRAP